MRCLVKPLLMLLLGGLVFLGLGPAPVSSGPQASAGLQAERALVQWLGGPIALCLPTNTPALPERPAHDPVCGVCCLPLGARGLALPPIVAALRPPPLASPLVWHALKLLTVAPVVPPQPLQPRAPPEWG